MRLYNECKKKSLETMQKKLIEKKLWPVLAKSSCVSHLFFQQDGAEPNYTLVAPGFAGHWIGIEDQLVGLHDHYK